MDKIKHDALAWMHVYFLFIILFCTRVTPIRTPQPPPNVDPQGLERLVEM